MIPRRGRRRKAPFTRRPIHAIIVPSKQGRWGHGPQRKTDPVRGVRAGAAVRPCAARGQGGHAHHLPDGGERPDAHAPPGRHARLGGRGALCALSGLRPDGHRGQPGGVLRAGAHREHLHLHPLQPAGHPGVRSQRRHLCGSAQRHLPGHAGGAAQRPGVSPPGGCVLLLRPELHLYPHPVRHPDPHHQRAGVAEHPGLCLHRQRRRHAHPLLRVPAAAGGGQPGDQHAPDPG